MITVSRNRRAKTGPRILPVLAVTPPAAAAISHAYDDLFILGVTLVPTSQCPNARTRSSASAATEAETTSGSPTPVSALPAIMEPMACGPAAKSWFR